MGQSSAAPYLTPPFTLCFSPVSCYSWAYAAMWRPPSPPPPPINMHKFNCSCHNWTTVLFFLAQVCVQGLSFVCGLAPLMISMTIICERETERQREGRWETVAGKEPTLNLNSLLIELDPGKQMVAAKKQTEKSQKWKPNSISLGERLAAPQLLSSFYQRDRSF